MGLRKELVAGMKAIVINELRTWTIVLIGAAVFFATAIAGNALFGEVVGLGLGIVCGLGTAAVLRDRLPTGFPADQQ